MVEWSGANTASDLDKGPNESSIEMEPEMEPEAGVEVESGLGCEQQGHAGPLSPVTRQFGHFQRVVCGVGRVAFGLGNWVLCGLVWENMRGCWRCEVC